MIAWLLLACGGPRVEAAAPGSPSAPASPSAPEAPAPEGPAAEAPAPDARSPDFASTPEAPSDPEPGPATSSAPNADATTWPPAPTPVDPDAPDWLQALATTGVSAEQLAKVRAIAAENPLLGTGRGPTKHPMTPGQCRERRAAAGLPDAPPANACGRPWMVPLPGSTACIDQLEFPGVPCAYPVIWVRASQAAAMCEAIGKRLCDASEWEDGCAGSHAPPDDLGIAAGLPVERAHTVLREAHNAGAERGYAYGETRRNGICAMGSFKNDGCDGGSPTRCGSNTYPAGAFPDCVSPIGVYDQHGNAAEHMSLPLSDDQRGHATGVTEMKGSWFIFDTYQAHPDWCRWRAPYWHGTPVRAADSHQNYHLGFRCCADPEE